MPTIEKSRISILSHVLPPSPSGQAVMLYRLLMESPFKLSFIQSGLNPYSGIATQMLPGNYHQLRQVANLPSLSRLKLEGVMTTLNSFCQVKYRARQIEKILVCEKCDLLIACTGNLFDLPAGFLAAQSLNIPFIPYIFDDYIYQWTGINRDIARKTENKIFYNIRNFIVPNEFAQKEYEKRYGKKGLIVRNPSSINLKDSEKESPAFFEADETAIVYAGAIYHAHYDAFRNLIDAIKKIGNPKIRLHLFTSQASADLREHGIHAPFIKYHAHLNQADIPVMLRQANILFLPLAFNSPINEVIRSSAPGKIGEYLASGTPVLVHAPADSFVSWFFVKHECGVVVSINSIEELANAVMQTISDVSLRHNLVFRGKKIADAEFDDGRVRMKFNEILREALSA